MVKMNDIDLPLDEIISQKRITLNRKRNQNIGGGVSSGAVRKLPAQRPQQLLSKPTLQRVSTTKDIGDVRNHLIQKKRKNMSDARDQLAKMAKSSGDIRDKLNLIRGTENGSSNKKPLDMRQKLNQRKSGNQGRKVTSVNSRQQQNQTDKSTAVGKTRIQGTSLLRTVTGLERKRFEPAPRQKISAPVTRTIHGNSSSGGAVRNQVVLKTRRSDPIAQNSRPIMRTTTAAQPRQQVRQTVVQHARPVQVRRNVPAQKTVYIREEPQPVYRQMPGSVRPMRTNPRARLEPLQSEQYIIEEDYEPEPEPQRRPTVVYRSVPRRPEPAVVYADEQYEEYFEDSPVLYSDQTDSYYADEVPAPQEVYIPPPARSQPQYRPAPRNQPQYRPQPQPVREQQYVPQQRPQQYASAPPLMQQRTVNPYSNQSRLVRQQPQQTVRRSAPIRQAQTVHQSHVAQVKAPSVVGHRVSVSNLHAATREDIEELFGNIGPISSCKMVRPDTAMVIFNNVNDAKKSVEVYHNRKLDNHPMQVKIVGTVTDGSARANRVRY